VALAAWLPAAVVLAADTTPLQVVVPLSSNSEAVRLAAFGDALRTAAVRASGRREAAQNRTIATAAGDPTRYVQRYAATTDGMLKVGFDAEAMQRLLQEAGLPSWPIERPVTLVIAPAADGEHALRAGEASETRSRFEEAARARGIPYVWPRAELSVEKARAALATDGPAAVARSTGVDADAVLVGRPGGDGLDWLMSYTGRTAERRGSGSDGAHLAADTLAEIFAPASTRGLSTVGIRVEGVDGLRSYAALIDYLESLSLVRRVSVVGLDGNTVRLQIALRGDLELLTRVAALGSRLRPAVGASGADFSFVP
jgi:hypothetical protein